MRSWLIALVMVLSGVTLAVVPAAPAVACSCAVSSTAEYAERADLVAVGTITGREVPENATSSADDATWTVEIDKVYKGDATPTVPVLTALEGPSCGWDHVSSGQTIILFANLDGEDVRSDLCSGTGAFTPELDAELATLLGSPAAPTEAPAAAPDEGGLETRTVVGLALLIAAAVVLVAGAARRHHGVGG
ncbi:hypothetical protein [Tessaracoccus flavus]|nr:hypothetical protein [Tessaracoccus flavus]SDY77193.1 hypothetical protein SAMN05428934_10479 [Tessaracoccus flavus]